MGRWRYTLKSGKAFREAVDSDDFIATLNALKTCYEEIHQQFPEDFDEYDLDDAYDDIDNEIDNVENYMDYDLTQDDVEDNVNYLLDNFYDTCDGLSIWVGF